MPLFTMAAVQLASILDQQAGKSETIVVPTDNQILARDQNTAIAMFGSKYHEKFAKANPDLLVIHIRQGI